MLISPQRLSSSSSSSSFAAVDELIHRNHETSMNGVRPNGFLLFLFLLLLFLAAFRPARRTFDLPLQRPKGSIPVGESK